MFRQKWPNKRVVRQGAEKTTDVRAGNGNPPGVRVKPGVGEPGQEGKKSGTKIARRVNRVTVHAAPRNADRHDHQTNQNRLQPREDWTITRIDNSEDQCQKECRADDLIEKTISP